MVYNSNYLFINHSLFKIENLLKCNPSKIGLSYDDYLNLRIKTLGISKLEFSMDKIPYQIVLTAGHRSERKKWNQLFTGNFECVFVVGLTQYFLNLYEVSNVNRLEEDLNCFKDYVNSEPFKDKKIILVFTRKDIFEQTLKEIPYENHVEKLNKEMTPLEDIIEKFKLRIVNSDRLIIKVISSLNEDDIMDLMETIKLNF